MAKSNLVVLTLVLALVSFTATASAMQQPAETGAPQAEESILVVGQRTREAIQAFARQMGATPRHNNQLARWDRSICPGVAGLRPRYAQFVIDRMAQRALDVVARADLRPARPARGVERRRRLVGRVRVEVVREEQEALGLLALEPRERRVGHGGRAALVLLVRLAPVELHVERLVVPHVEALVDRGPVVERERAEERRRAEARRAQHLGWRRTAKP